MDGIIGGLLGYLQDPRRTQQVQGIGNAIEQGLLRLQESDKRFKELADRAFDPKNPGRIKDKEALKELTDMTMTGLLGFAPAGMIAPRLEAMKIAQKNASKPVSEGGLGLPPDNTAMDRAKAMGFRTKDKLYHGTPEENIKEFIPTPHDETAILGTSLTSDPKIAEFYAKGRGFSDVEGANIIPVMIRGKKPQDYDKFISYLINNDLLNDPKRQLTLDAKNFLESKGISAFDMSSLYGDEIQVVNPSRIRSIFAAFDPMRKNEADILAGLLPLGLLADEEMRKKLDEALLSY